MTNKLIKERKNTVAWHQTADYEVYKTFYTHCKKLGIKIQDRIRVLISEDLNKPTL